MKAKQIKLSGVIAFAIIAIIAMPAFAGKGGHGSGDNEMDHTGHVGKSIHESEVDDFQLAYHTIDNKEQMKKMKDMKGMKMGDHKDMKSHHLMVYIVGHDGHKFEGGKVGFMVEGPDGKQQKAMAMFMKGGYGADVDLAQKGSYTIKTKAQNGDKKVIDSFTYEVK